jgi:Flp pilus assembly protein TadD
VIIGLVVLQTLDVLQGAWMIKRLISAAACYTLGVPLEHSFEQTFVTALRSAGLLEPFQPPPRVFVTPSLVPRNYGMIYRYSNFDADWPPFLQRPWDYLHAVLGIPPGVDKGSLSPQVYRHGPFPYPDLGLAAGFDPRSGKVLVATNPAPRAFLVYAAEVADYRTILDRLTRGYDLHRCALLETPLAEPLPRENTLPGMPVLIRRFEPDSLVLDVDAREKALLVLAEAWYPGWRAKMDGQVCECVPANVWMRAVPVPAGRHQVRVYFRQDHLVPGLLISLASAALLLAVLARPKHLTPPGPDEPKVPEMVTAPPMGGNGSPEQKAPPPLASANVLSIYFKPFCVLAAGGLAVWLVGGTERQRLRRFHSMKTNVDASTHYQKATSFTVRHQTAPAIAHYTEVLRLKPDSVEALNSLAWIRAASAHAEFRNGPGAVRLAQRACELTQYQVPLYVGTLAAAYAEAGRFDEAVAAAARARDLALAGGQSELAAGILKLMDLYQARKPVWKADQLDESHRE